ncbi:Holliday junction branch migration protein RuvA [Candidatus Saccharibacteria bacterium]|nr:MAG: Holliday junction branch migration protein RuvA [Candidatus Saccharibacteria bacterium]
MIAHVEGTIAEKFGNALIVDVGGVGYEVTVTLADFDAFTLNQRAKLYTYHHIREQAEELFGFSSLTAKKLFEMLITVQGVGPKAALAILSLGEAEHVRNAIANADSSYISGASGVGKKTAERVVVDLSDKVGMPIVYAKRGGVQTELPTSDEALEALIALGYTLSDATRALEGIDTTLPTSERVREALKGH